MKRFVAALMLVGGFLSSVGANAGLTVSYQQVGGNVVVTISGSFDPVACGGLDSNSIRTMSSQAQVDFYNGSAAPPVGGSEINVGAVSQNASVYLCLNGTPNLPNPLTNYASSASNLYFASDSSTGDPISFWLDGNYGLGLPAGTTGATQLLGTSTFNNKTFSDFGITSGTSIVYTYTNANVTDTITVNVGPQTPPAAVPSLSEWTQLLLALMTFTLVGWHSHRGRSY